MLLTGRAPVRASGRPERLHAQPGDRQPRGPWTDPGVPLGQAQQAPGGLLGDGPVVTARSPLGLSLCLMMRRRRRMLGSAVGTEEHLKEEKDKSLQMNWGYLHERVQYKNI